jgi:hypothetical protein
VFVLGSWSVKGDRPQFAISNLFGASVQCGLVKLYVATCC